MNRILAYALGGALLGLTAGSCRDLGQRPDEYHRFNDPFKYAAIGACIGYSRDRSERRKAEKDSQKGRLNEQ